MTSIPYSAYVNHDERTPGERGYDDGYEGLPYYTSAYSGWSDRQMSEYDEAFQRSLEAREDLRLYLDSDNGWWED